MERSIYFIRVFFVAIRNLSTVPVVLNLTISCLSLCGEMSRLSRPGRRRRGEGAVSDEHPDGTQKVLQPPLHGARRGGPRGGPHHRHHDGGSAKKGKSMTTELENFCFYYRKSSYHRTFFLRQIGIFLFYKYYHYL